MSLVEIKAHVIPVDRAGTPGSKEMNAKGAGLTDGDKVRQKLPVRTRVGPDHAHGGKYGLVESDDVGSVYQDVSGLQPGRRYQITAWVSASPGTTAPAHLAVFDPVANVATYSDSLIPQPRWQPLKQSVTASDSGILRIHLFREHGAGTVYWDDVRILEER